MRTHRYFIQKYLESRPDFFSFIRSQEAFLFSTNLPMMKKPILDFGSGDGFFASTIFNKRGIDVGLDVLSSRINESPQTNIYKKLTIYDGITIPYKGGTFGTIISNCVFEHVPQIEKSVQEIYRITKKGGYLMTTVMCSSWSNNLLGGKIFGNIYVDWFNRMQHHDSLLSKKEWAALFKKAGYDVVESVDYLFEKAAQKTEVYHFLSIFSLITYLLFKKWKLFSHVTERKISEVENIIKNDKKNPSACFFVLRKK
jgi:SAM-dependent methyltransferase